MKGILCRIDSAEGFGKLPLFQFFFNCQGEFSQRLDVSARVKFHLLKFGENSERLFQITGLRLFFRHVGTWRCGRGFSGLILLCPSRLLMFAWFWSVLCLLLMFLLSNFLSVGNVSRI